MNRRILLALLTLISLTLLGGCRPVPADNPRPGRASVTLVADGNTRIIEVSDAFTVNDVLEQAGVAPDPLDRLNPPGYSPVEDGLIITLVRVREETAVGEEVVPFQRRTVPNVGLAEGETQLLQAGQNGVAEITYRVLYEDGVEVSRTEVRRVVLTPPEDEVVMVGQRTDLPTVTVEGTLVYLYNGNAWVMRENSANRRPLTLEGGLDGKVFELSADGHRLLYTRSTGGEATPAAGEPFNELWAVFNTRDPEAQPLRLDLNNILFAAWVPGAQRTIVFSTAEPRDSFPGWQANNDLWRGKIAPDGQVVEREQLMEAWAGGVYGWYGTTFAYAPDGVTLAWAQPDAVGVLTPVYPEPEPPPEGEPEGEEEGEPEPTPVPIEPAEVDPALLPARYERQTLLSFVPWNAYDFVWVPSPVWSPDGTLIVTPTHGPPLGGEQPEDSPVFPLTAIPAAGTYSVNLVEQAGMWAEPAFSPTAAPDGTPLPPRLAYLQAIRPLESVNSRYQLVLMDVDGSNRQVVFPPGEQPGLAPQPYTWSPDGRQLAFVNPGPEGALIMLDPATGLARQVTEGQTSTPRWAP